MEKYKGQKNENYLLPLWELSKEFGSKFPDGYRLQQNTLEKDRRVQRPKPR